MLALLNAFKKRGKRPPRLRNFFIDPSTLLEDNAGDLWSFLQSLHGERHQFQLGRECTDERVASTLGRHYHGKPRDQRRLDAEGEVVKKLARMLPDSRFKVFYIMSPFECEQSISTTLREVESLAECGNVYTGSNLLWPLPGSPNRVKHRGLYLSFEDIPPELAREIESLALSNMNFWHPGLPASDLLDYLMATEVKMYVEPELPNNTLYHLTMMKILSSIAFGAYTPGETIPRLADELPSLGAPRPGDIDSDLPVRLLRLGQRIDDECLHDPTTSSKIRLATLIRSA